MLPSFIAFLSLSSMCITS